jgi:hypothetical protein
LSGLYHQDSVETVLLRLYYTARTILSGVCCEDSIILMMYGDKSSRASETIGDYYSTSTRLFCEDCIIKASSIGNVFDGPTASVLRRLFAGVFSVV